MSKPVVIRGFILLLPCACASMLPALASATDKIYWSDGRDPMALMRANLDGSAAQIIVANVRSTWIAIDSRAGRVYWLGEGGIQSADLDGENVETVISTDCGVIEASLDLVERKLYWVEIFRCRVDLAKTYSRVRRANLDGSEPETLLEAFGTPEGLALDLSRGAIYWADTLRGDILRGTFDAVPPTFLASAQRNGNGLALDETLGVVYWCGNSQRVHRTSPSGTGDNVFVTATASCRGDMGIDPIDRTLYWRSFKFPEREIAIAWTALDGDGSDVQLHLPCLTGEGVGHLAVDPIGRKIYWTCADSDGARIRRAALDFTGAEDVLLLQGDASPLDMAVDFQGNKLYWASRGGDIFRSRLDGSEMQTFLTGVGATWLQFENTERSLYWTWREGIARSPVDSEPAPEEVFWRGTSRPIALAIDGSTEKIFIGQRDCPYFLRANLDGSELEPLVQFGSTGGLDIALDARAGKLYWAAEHEGVIGRMNLDGTKLETLLRVTSISIALDIPRGKLYWSEFMTGRIWRSNLDGTSPETILHNLFLPWAIALLLDCDNGIVDEGETCDVAIPFGEPGACPASCSDGLFCTSDELVGDGTCEAVCVFTPIVDPINGDGCCPAGANANNDNDCQPVCGNNACEPSEDHRTCPNDCTTIPTTSAWGAGVLLLSLLIGAKIAFGRRRSRA